MTAKKIIVVSCLAATVASAVEWPMGELRKTPRVYPAAEYRTNDVEVAFLEGLPYKGRPTRMFCYWGVPKHAPDAKVPGMVLVHGGGGSAFYRWVKYWNGRGYAAVSMDTCGCISGNVVGSEQRRHFRHEHGGPAGWGGFDTLDEDIKDQWMYHAVADAIIGNSFIRSLPGVDPDRIGLTGVSWGGVITCVAAPVDDRVRFAAPVYGCGGFLGTSSMWDDVVTRMGSKVRDWEALWDPICYLPKVKAPILWLASSNDTAFDIRSLMRSYDAVKGEKSLSLKVRLGHTHGSVSENSPEIEAFADSFCKGTRPLSRFGQMTFDRDSGRASAKVFSDASPGKVSLVYTCDKVELRDRRLWNVVDTSFNAPKGIAEADISSGVAAFYFNAVDDRGLVFSSAVVDSAAHARLSAKATADW